MRSYGRAMRRATTCEELSSNRRAPLNRESDYSALELFVNAGDSLCDLQRFRSQHPDFFSIEFYERSEQQALSGGDTLFNWYKRLLQRVWEKQDRSNFRLSILLGLWKYDFTNPAIPEDFQQEWGAHTKILAKERSRSFGASSQQQVVAPALPEFSSELVPDWEKGSIVFHSHIRAPRAIYALMRESWKARVCRMCRKYLIADKSATSFCSVQCAAEGKKQRDREIWKTKGSPARAARRAKGKAAGETSRQRGK